MDSSKTITFAGNGLALIIIMFWGDPDIADALIHFLMTYK